MSVIVQRYYQWRWMIDLVLIIAVALALPPLVSGLSINYGDDECEKDSTGVKSDVYIDAFAPDKCGFGNHDPGNAVPAYCKAITTKNRRVSLPTSNITNKIGGGHYAVRGQFPSYAKVNIWARNDKGQDVGIDCGGTIIHKNIILTAAHCWDEKQMNAVILKANVMVGDVELSTGGQMLEVVKICKHTRYVHPVDGDYNFSFDIAMITLDRDIEYNDYARPACLEVFAPHREEATCYAVGMGQINEARYKDYRVKYVEMKRNCRLGPEGYKFEESERRVFGSTCYKAASAGGGCVGDSGGPIICFDICRGRYFQFVIGAISFGNNFRDGQHIPPVCSEWNNSSGTYISDIHKLTGDAASWLSMYECATIR